MIYAAIGALLGAITGAVLMAVLTGGVARRSPALPVQVVKSELLLPFELERGLVAYEAYKRGCAGIAPETRAPLPDWKELHPDIQTVWCLVANQVLSEYGELG